MLVSKYFWEIDFSKKQGIIFLVGFIKDAELCNFIY